MTDRENSDIQYIVTAVKAVTDKVDRILVEQGSQGASLAALTREVGTHGDQLSQLVLTQHDQGKYIDGQIQQKITESGNLAAIDQAKLGASYNAKYTFAYSLLSTFVVIAVVFVVNKVFHLNLMSN